MILGEGNQMQMEARDWHYILGRYIRRYQFLNKGAIPDEIVFPMFESVPHPTKGQQPIPVRYVPEISPEAQAIAEDGENVPETSEEELTAIEVRDREIEELRKRVSEFEGQPDKAFEPMPPEESDAVKEAKAEAELQGVNPDEEAMRADIAPAPENSDRKPIMPEHPAEGQPDDTYPKDPTMLTKVRSALRDDPDIDESAEKPFEKTVTRDEKGEPKVEE